MKFSEDELAVLAMLAMLFAVGFLVGFGVGAVIA